METTETAPTHHTAAADHLARRDNLLRQARGFDFRTLHLEPHCSQYNALIAGAEIEHGMALACAEEGR